MNYSFLYYVKSSWRKTFHSTARKIFSAFEQTCSFQWKSNMFLCIPRNIFESVVKIFPVCLFLRIWKLKKIPIDFFLLFTTKLLNLIGDNESLQLKRFFTHASNLPKSFQSRPNIFLEQKIYLFRIMLQPSTRHLFWYCKTSK